MNGAKIIEKHFTLNKNLKGAYHHISLEPKEFKTMVLVSKRAKYQKPFVSLGF